MKFSSFYAVIACVCISFLTSACQTTPQVKTDQAFQITQVEVNKASADIGTVNLAEDVRAKAQNAAYKYSEHGQEKVLKVTLTNLHFKNAVTSLLIGDANRMTATARVVDKASGVVDTKFDSTVISKAVLNGISGAIISAAQNPIEVEQQLATELADKIMLQAYGNAYARTIKDRTPTKSTAPKYPRNYADLKFEFYCASKKQTNFDDGSTNSELTNFKMPEECKKLAAVAQ